ncbi:MAG: PAS domain S-box protein [Candidatus Competibacteraceae bacterium]|nr:PAS domain S-box protein [Candidatus Competibacteraceae bacterium]
MEVIKLHLAQRLILLELLVDWDLVRYQNKKASIKADLALHQKQLNYLNILLGNEPTTDAIIASLVRKLDSLILQEQTIFRHFTTIIGLNDQLAYLGSRLLVASKAFTGKLRVEILESNRINQILGWSLPTILLAALGILGVLLARNIIQFVKELESNRQELQINEGNLRVTLDSIGDAVIATDHRGRITRMNPSAELLTGWKLASASGRKLSEVFHIVNAHTRARVVDPAEKVMASGKVVGLANHTVLLANDGKEYQIADSGAPIRAPDGRIIGVVLVFRDVTENYVQEQKLRESEKQLRKITANVPGVVYRFECTPEHRCATTFVGESLRQWFGLEPDPATFAQAFRSGIPDEDRERYDRSLREAIRQSHPWHYEGRFRKESGELIWFTGDAIPYQEESGTTFYGVVQDITERKRSAETLRRLRNYLSNIINSMPSVLVVVDRKGRVTLWNKSAEQATGLTFDQVHRQPLATVFPRLTDQIHSIETALDKRETIHESKVPIQRQDETLFEDITIFPLVANGVEGAVIRLDNVTERVRIEEIMIQSEKMLSVGGLAAGMAHEINNPLAGILQTAEVLANRLSNEVPIPANEKAATTAGTTLSAIQTFMELRGIPRMLKTIKESGNRVAAIVDNMLSFARKSDVTVSSHNIAELIDRTLTLAATDYNLKRQYDFKAIEIRKDYEENLPQVPCESAKIQQVLLNILSNGAQAMVEAGTSGPRFTLRTRWEPERNSVRIEIEDNGPSMEPAISRRVFEPFYTTKPIGVGTGLGLSVSYLSSPRTTVVR